jgi:hypothetical protein
LDRSFDQYRGGSGFTQQCPCIGDPYDDSQENNGVVLPDNVNMRLFAPIDCPNGRGGMT